MDRYDELYTDLCSSLTRWAAQKVTALQGEFPGLQFVDWDAHSELHELPSGDLLGPAGVAMTDQGKFFEATVSVGLSTMNDPNLFRIRALASKVFADFRPERKLPVYRSETAVVDETPVALGWLVFQPPTIITPMSRAETRILQFVNAQGMLSPRLPHVG